MHPPRVFALVTIVALIGCGDGRDGPAGGTSPSSSNGAGGGSASVGVGGGVTDAYPPAPYGNMVGDTMAPLQWEGYVNASGDGPALTQPWGDFSTDHVRKSDTSHALIHLAGLF